MAKKKKSAAQIRRLEQRALKRGETYVPPPPSPKEEKQDVEPTKQQEEEENVEQDMEQSELDDDATSKKRRLEIAIRLTNELKTIEEKKELFKSKDRRSAKRKAEAIATEESGMPVVELLKWYETQQQQDQQQKSSETKGSENEDPLVVETKRRKAAMKLQSALQDIETNAEMKAKDRRSAKRKAEAIAAEESGMSAEELLQWFESQEPKQKDKESNKQQQRNHDPYIAFIGQLSFDTTQEQLLEHVLSQLKTDFPKIKPTDLRIRLLTNPKTNKSRGMAFCEVMNDDPELLYALLKLHQTYLNGRRINVERSAGGKKNSEKRKQKIQQYRKEQDEYFAEIVDNILNEYKQTGELREDELDDGVISLCKRHAGPVVRAAVAKYIEGSGRDMDNPSAYLTFLITKFAEEGIYEDDDDQPKTKHTQKPKRKKTTSSNEDRHSSSSKKRLRGSSEFARSGVDMSQSEGTSSDVSKIFPSARRGRGYMM
eukprot:scaffold2466_cov120-Cylindrotheca_fusiformis.AAC.6